MHVSRDGVKAGTGIEAHLTSTYDRKAPTHCCGIQALPAFNTTSHLFAEPVHGMQNCKCDGNVWASVG